MPSIKAFLTNKNLFLFGLFLVIVGMPMSKFLMSLGQFVLLGNWTIEGDFKRKWNVIKTSKVLWVLSSFYFMHLIGLLWTSDFNYAANDLRIKLPLLWFPLLFATSKPLSKKEIDVLLYFFIASAFLASMISMLVLLGLTKKKVTDIRDISIFNSHIRFALMIVLSICILLYDYLSSKALWQYILKALLVLWFIIFLMIMESLTGILILCVILFYIFVRYMGSRKSMVLKYSPFIIMLGAVIYLGVIIKREWNASHYQKPFNYNTLEKFTVNGNPYLHDTSRYKQKENGNYVNIYVCPSEMRQAWNQRSKLDFDGKDLKGNSLPITLTRYLTSKGIRKDAAAINTLSEEDVKAIENGSTNYLYKKGNIKTRIHELIYEYDSYIQEKNPSGHSLFMRLEFWKTGLQIIHSHPFLGVGTGDVQQAYNTQYKKENSKLAEEWRLRSHNQFMAITVAFGFVGLTVFLCWLFLPVLLIKNKHSLFIVFFIISLLSMLNEDTLETQAGVTFYGFFYCFLLFNKNKEIKKSGQAMNK